MLFLIGEAAEHISIRRRHGATRFLLVFAARGELLQGMVRGMGPRWWVDDEAHHKAIRAAEKDYGNWEGECLSYLSMLDEAKAHMFGKRDGLSLDGPVFPDERAPFSSPARINMLAEALDIRTQRLRLFAVELARLPGAPRG